MPMHPDSVLEFNNPGIAPWHALIAAWALGALALEQPLAASCALGLFVFMLAPPRGRAVLPMVLALAGFGLGLGHAWAVLPVFSDSGFESSGRKAVAVHGRTVSVKSLPGQKVRIILENVVVPEGDRGRESLPGRLAWTWWRPVELPAPGQEVRARLKVRPVRGFLNFGAWNSRDWWLRQGVTHRAYSRGSRAKAEFGPRPSGVAVRLRDLRRGVVDRVADLVQPDESRQGRAVLAALVTGDRYGLDSGVLNLVRRSSLAHSLALSGLHVGFVAALGAALAWMAGLLRPGIYLVVPRPKLAAATALFPALAYAWLGGMTPSLIRASAMLFGVALMLFMGRPRFLLDGLVAALALILAVSPLAVYDIRLQFSFLAVLGLALGMPPLLRALRAFLPRGHAGRVLAVPVGVLMVSMCANLALLPLLVFNFGTLPLSLWLNAVWLPVLGLWVMPVGLIGLVLGLVPWLGGPASWLLGLASWPCQVLVDFLAVLDSARLLPELVPMRPGWTGVIGYYAVAGAILAAARLPRRAAVLAMCGLVMAAFSGLSQSLPLPGPRLTVLDTGQSQAVVFELPDRRRILMDGGGAFGDDFDLGRAVTGPALSAGRSPELHIASMSHPDQDHAQGLHFILDHFRVGAFMHNGQWQDGAKGEAMRGALTRQGVPVSVPVAGDRVDLGGGFVLEVLHPPRGYVPGEDNDDSLVLRLVRDGRGLVLVPGDVEARGLDALMRFGANFGADLSARVLVLPHHGSRSSFSPEFYGRVDPDMALAACGADNFFGFPHPDVCRVLDDMGIPLYSTAGHGALRLEWGPPGAAPRLERFCGE